MSADNWSQFENIDMWRGYDETNMEYLFNLTNADGGDPAASSLFNLTTLKTLVSLGQAAPNIVGDDKNMTYVTDFNLTGEWTTLAETLGLNETDDTSVGPKRAYMLWLWMRTAWDLTFELTDNSQNGNYQIGVIGQIGSKALEDKMQTMRLEFPMLTLATQLQINVTNSNMNCNDIYT